MKGKLAWLSLDLRSLALLRICYGIILAQDLLIRATDLSAHYTDWGAMPRQAVLELGWWPPFWSFHMINGTLPFQAFLFLVALLAALALALGYYTTTASWVSWVMLVSLHNRNPVVLDGGDNYIRVVLFWCCFMPWGARWSLDALRSRRAEAQAAPAVGTSEGGDSVELSPEARQLTQNGAGNSWLDAAALAYTMQISLVYLFAALLKIDPVWTSEASAVYYALMIDQLATPRAQLLLNHPEWMKFLTASTLTFEKFGWVLLWLVGPLRLIGVIGLFCLHLGFGLFMHLGVFALIGMCSAFGLIPGFVWDWVERRPEWKRLTLWLGRHLDRPELSGFEVPRVAHHPQHIRHFIALAMVYVIAWNLTSLPGTRLDLGALANPGRVLRLDQQWNMFAPKPLQEDGWYVIEATRVDGKVFDLYRDGAEISWVKPEHVASTYSNARWRKFMMNIWSRDLSDWRLHYGRYLTRRWNSTHQGGEQIVTFRIYFMLEMTLPQGTKPIEKTLIWTHQCMDQPKNAAKSAPTTSPSPIVPSPQVTGQPK